MKKLFISAAAVLAALSLNAQVFTCGDIHKVNTTASIERPAISADGSFVVAQGNGALQKIDLATGATENLVEGNGLYGISLSEDGKTVVYIRPSYTKNHLRMTAMEAVNTDTKKVETIVKPSRDMAAGAAVSNREVKAVNDGKVTKKAINKNAEATAERPVVAISYGHLTVNGNAIDPQGKASYLWPSLSPDGTKIVYWCSYRGCFVCDLDGSNVQPVGNLQAAVWAGNDALVGMQSQDNGEYITASKIVAFDLGSKKSQTLTGTDMIAMYPSATASRVSFVDGEGALYFMDINK